MQIPEDPFAIRDLYDKALEDISSGTYKSKKKCHLEDMRQIFIAHGEINKITASVAPYIMMIDGEISKRESVRTNFILLWAAIIAAIFAVIASWPIVKDWLPAFQSGEKSATSQSSQSNSIPK